MVGTSTETQGNPQVGMLAHVRNRRALIVSVEPFDGRDGRTHLVQVEYSDFDAVPEETLIWEREHGATVIPWRANKSEGPTLRRTVLSLVTFHELEKIAGVMAVDRKDESESTGAIPDLTSRTRQLDLFGDGEGA